MSVRSVFCIFGGGVLFLFLIDKPLASQYVVSRVGDTATYGNAVTGTEIRVEVDRGVRRWNHYTEFAGLGPLWIASYGRDERVYVYAPAERSIQLLADFSAPIGFSTPLGLEPCNHGTATLAARETVAVPAGSFTDVFRIDFETSCADAGVTSAWFARGVGPIQWTADTIAGPSTYQMVAASIGGTHYPDHSGISLLGEFPGPMIWIDMMPGTPGPAQIINVFLTIQNRSADNFTYSFSTGQHFEIQVIDTAGVVVSKWSRGKAFTQAFNDLTIAPGAERRFGGPVELTYDDGRPLAQGSYTLKIFLTNANPPGTSPPQSAAPIQVGWAY